MAGNHNSGRKPKPSALKVWEGNRGKRPIPDEVQPTGQATRPIFGERQVLEAEFWDAVIPRLQRIGLATDCDQEYLEELCHWWAEYQLAKLSLDRLDQVRCWKTFDSIAQRFGMTPQDRAGLQVAGLGKQDETEQFLA